MLTDWLIWLDFLEENNCNTSFLRLVTPIVIPQYIPQNCFYVKNKFLPNIKINKTNIQYQEILCDFIMFDENIDLDIENGNGFGYIDLYHDEEE